MGPLLFLTYINDLPDGTTTTAELFADDTSIFSTVLDLNQSLNDLNHDLTVINNWSKQWKMLFNPDINKQAMEVVFSRKRNPPVQPLLTFNQSFVTQTDAQKHLGLILDKKLMFDIHLSEKISKANKGIGAIKRLFYDLPRKSLLSMYKLSVRPHLDYADVVYDQPYNSSFCQKLESIQYNAALAITGAIRGTSRERLYQELGLEALSDRRWFRRICLFYKIVNGLSPEYLASFFQNYRSVTILPEKICMPAFVPILKILVAVSFLFVLQSGIN